jgi:hypothetical protein
MPSSSVNNDTILPFLKRKKKKRKEKKRKEKVNTSCL